MFALRATSRAARVLAAKAEAGDQSPVALDVVLSDVVEQPATPAPLASGASLPAENERDFWVPLMGPETDTSAMNGSFGAPAHPPVAAIWAALEPVPSCQPPEVRPAAGDWCRRERRA